MAEARIGTAGWSVARDAAEAFPAEGSGLERYAARFGCAEVNSSFHRSHREETWRRWAASVPEDFRFSAKLSKQVTHEKRLADCEEELASALAEMGWLGDKLAVVLVQLPPSLGFDAAAADRFFASMRGKWEGAIAFEPRHASWFESEAEALLLDHRIARVAADPARIGADAKPGGWSGHAYYRLHGSPRIYRSSYDDGRIEEYAARIKADVGAGRDAWCIFDNTASSAATGDALKLLEFLEYPRLP